ncbi:MAG: RelA/SpoT family protein [Moritella sp.]|nr:MAG: RelA/SpoT family protein [Moritella sp.]
MYVNHDVILLNKLHAQIENELNRLGLLFRVFSRSKSEESIKTKISSKAEGYYSVDGKKLQDLYGIRIALYFPDDLQIAQKALEGLYILDSKEVDKQDSEIFSATRCNYVFKLKKEISDESYILKKIPLVDDTFEVQFRTILSEGWHEVEHDLRYKCKDDWDDHPDLKRALNGIYASLETSEWGMTRLFEDLAHRHYKSSEWPAMMRNKFRLRAGNVLSSELENAINTGDLGKKIFRLNRAKLLLTILKYKIDIPINLNNILYICNHFFLKSSVVNDVTPHVIRAKFSELEDHYNNNKKKMNK